MESPAKAVASETVAARRVTVVQAPTTVPEDVNLPLVPAITQQILSSATMAIVEAPPTPLAKAVPSVIVVLNGVSVVPLLSTVAKAVNLDSVLVLKISESLIDFCIFRLCLYLFLLLDTRLTTNGL